MLIEGKINIEGADMQHIFLVFYYLVDELYKEEPCTARLRSRGEAPDFTDSEVITIALVGSLFNKSETAWHNYVRRNFLPLFPKLVERSRFNRRVRDLYQVIILLYDRISGLIDVDSNLLIMDSCPVPVCKYARRGRNTNWAEGLNGNNSALYGYCAAKKEKYYGFKLNLLVNEKGCIKNFVLSPSGYHDISIMPELLENSIGDIALGDKGYIGWEGYDIGDRFVITPKKKNQEKQNSKLENFVLSKYRKIIETVNSILVEQLNIQSIMAKSLFGLKARIAQKIAALTLCSYLNSLAEKPLLSVKSIIF